MLIAFDIDGTLTEGSVLQSYKELDEQNGIEIGIVTRRTPSLSNKFIESKNIEPSFVRNRVVKTIALNNLYDSDTHNRHIYVGNRISDYMYTELAGWEFVLAQSVESTQDILHN